MQTFEGVFACDWTRDYCCSLPQFVEIMVRISAHTHDQCSEVDEINVMIWFQSQSTTTNNNKISEPDKPTYTLWLINHGISLAGRPISSTLFQRTASGNGLSNIYCSRSVPIKSLGLNFDLGVNRRLSQVPQMEKVTTTVSNLCHKLLKKNKDLSLYKKSRGLGRNGGSVGKNTGCQRFIRSIHHSFSSNIQKQVGTEIGRNFLIIKRNFVNSLTR